MMLATRQKLWQYTFCKPCSDGSEPFLTCCVPDLQLYCLGIEIVQIAIFSNRTNPLLKKTQTDKIVMITIFSNKTNLWK